MTAGTLPENLNYCFAPVEDTEAEVHQIRIFVEDMAYPHRPCHADRGRSDAGRGPPQ